MANKKTSNSQKNNSIPNTNTKVTNGENNNSSNTVRRTSRGKPQSSTEKAVAQKATKGLLPVTLISGFLGAGKTALLKQILTNRQGKKYAVIVNDMAELNIDAEIVKNANLLQTQEKVVQLQNGCICCTLRADLLVEIAKLAKSSEFDYLVIESTGISEPMQVAETFTFSLDDDVLSPSSSSNNNNNSSKSTSATPILKKKSNATPSNSNNKHHTRGINHQHNSKEEDGDDDNDDELTIPEEEAAEIIDSLKSLKDLARLDTCVTVIDACSFDDTFKEADRVCNVYPDADKRDDRNISDLMVDQIEFANVILLNKTDLVSSSTLNRIKALIHTMNPDAQIFLTQYSNIPLEKITNTGLFNFEKAALSPGWMKSLEGTLIPETEEYGVSSFVYRSRRPFHARRLWNLLRSEFVVQEDNYTPPSNAADDDDNIDDNEGEEEKDGDNMKDGEMDGKDEEDEEMEEEEDEEEEIFKESITRVKNYRAANGEKLVFGGVLRSKGFFWMGSRYDLQGEWSQSGLITQIGCGGVFFACLHEDEWPIQDETAKKRIYERFLSEEEEKKVWNELRGELRRKLVMKKGKNKKFATREVVDDLPQLDSVVGDRRQEIVFIGANMNKEKIIKSLNQCLVTNEEWLWYLKLVVDDPWLSWPHPHEFLLPQDMISEERTAENMM